jgi:hypothetical protein
MLTNISSLINHIDQSIDMANNNQSKVNNYILGLFGFSGNKTRHLYNNICNMSTKTTYLEVGTYKGSTFISALYKNNQVYGIAVDNWSEFDGSNDNCNNVIKSFIPISQYQLIERDCFSLNYNDISPDSINIYLYDGDHSYASHIKAITHFEKFLSPISIIMIDDFREDESWKSVIDGTMDGFKESKLEILYERRLVSQQEISGKQNYWNGCGIFLCKKI